MATTMRERIARRKAFSSSSIGAPFSQPAFWTLDSPTWGSSSGEKERIAEDFGGYVTEAYKASGIVFTCSLVRLQVFSQIAFVFKDRADGAFTYDADTLDLLENPWPNGTTGDLLARMEQDASIAGNSFVARRTSPIDSAMRIRRLRPDWVTILTGSPSDDPFDIDAEVLGYWYEPKAGPRKALPVFLTPAEVVHWAPLPDPAAQWRGMSWLTPVLREIEADKAATKHKLKFFERGAVSNLAVVYDKEVPPAKVKEYIDLFRERYEGADNAYKTLHVGGGGDPKSIGANMQQLDFKATQGAGETRIASASGVGAIIAQFSEGMQGSSLNAGNYGAARRRFSDITMQHLWQTAADALAKFAEPPEGSRLWFDRSGVPFLQEDEKDAAEILKVNADTVARLTDAGYHPDAAVRAITGGDLTQLTGEHSGLFSVQLQPPGSNDPAATVSVSEPKSLKSLIDAGWRIVDVKAEAT